MHYVYCLQSVKNAKLYIGYTSDLKRRFGEHNRKQGGSFTEKNGPWKLIFYEAHQSKKDAGEMERFYKTGYGREVLQKKLKDYLSLVAKHWGVAPGRAQGAAAGRQAVR